MDYGIKIDADTFKLLAALLSTGKAEKDGKSIDFSPVQTITLKDNKLLLDPPAKVSAKFGPLRLRTTLSAVTLNESGEQSIEIELDKSPVDIEIKPSSSPKAWGF